MAWVAEGDENQNGTIDFGEFCLIISKMWAANFHDIRGAARERLVKDRQVSLKSVHGTYLAASRDGQVTSLRAEAGDAETFVMARNPNGNICLQSSFGKFITVVDTVVQCIADAGTQFKVITMEDELIILAASTSMGGNLFVRGDGVVAVSDGNPADVPFTFFTAVSREDSGTKCWSKTVMTRKPRKGVERKGSKDSRISLDDPALASAIQDMDSSLERKSSARGDYGPSPCSA
jgi:hypothetical protein